MNQDAKKTYFIICSDEKIDLKKFKNLNISQNTGNEIEDLFLLAKTDFIIGANSTFGAFASYYGNIPFLVFDHKIDWGYYFDKKYYFENKYSTMVNY
jgi:hypothetical protein